MNQDDSVKAVEETIKPLMDQLLDACIANHVPCLISVGVKRDGGNDELCTSYFKGWDRPSTILGLSAGVLGKQISYTTAALLLFGLGTADG
jgi:hypothetical protein